MPKVAGERADGGLFAAGARHCRIQTPAPKETKDEERIQEDLGNRGRHAPGGRGLRGWVRVLGRGCPKSPGSTHPSIGNGHPGGRDENHHPAGRSGNGNGVVPAGHLHDGQPERRRRTPNVVRAVEVGGVFAGRRGASRGRGLREPASGDVDEGVLDGQDGGDAGPVDERDGKKSIQVPGK